LFWYLTIDLQKVAVHGGAPASGSASVLATGTTATDVLVSLWAGSASIRTAADAKAALKLRTIIYLSRMGRGRVFKSPDTRAAPSFAASRSMALPAPGSLMCGYWLIATATVVVWAFAGTVMMLWMPELVWDGPVAV
jgi:hypothetical protein